MLHARWALPWLALLLVGCPGDPGPRVRVGGKRFSVEVRSDDEGRARGLMFRDALGSDAGMLFVYPEQRPIAFWMKNTRLPLDILFFDQEARFIGAHYGVPPCLRDPCPSYRSAAPARYALELQAGVGSALALKPGDVMELPEL